MNSLSSPGSFPPASLLYLSLPSPMIASNLRAPNINFISKPSKVYLQPRPLPHIRLPPSAPTQKPKKHLKLHMSASPSQWVTTESFNMLKANTLGSNSQFFFFSLSTFNKSENPLISNHFSPSMLLAQSVTSLAWIMGIPLNGSHDPTVTDKRKARVNLL